MCASSREISAGEVRRILHSLSFFPPCHYDCQPVDVVYFNFCFQVDQRFLIGNTYAWKWECDPSKNVAFARNRCVDTIPRQSPLGREEGREGAPLAKAAIERAFQGFKLQCAEPIIEEIQPGGTHPPPPHLPTRPILLKLDGLAYRCRKVTYSPSYLNTGTHSYGDHHENHIPRAGN
jgi:hypothetical protein